MGGTAKIIRAGCSKENVYVAGLQCFFRNDVESFLRILETAEKSCLDWIRYFKDVQAECLKFCFMNIIQAVEFVKDKKKSTNPEALNCRPDVLYFLPKATASRDLVTPVLD